MSRFEELLQTQVASMRLGWHPKRMTNVERRKDFQEWKRSLHEGDPDLDRPYALEGVPDEEDTWSLYRAYILYRDRELTIDTHSWWYEGGKSFYHYDWYDRDRAALYARLQEQASIIALFIEELSLILDVYESHCTSRDFTWHMRRSDAKAVASFFGHAFRPLMEAFRLHMHDERESVLYPCASNIEAKEVNRLIGEHLGVLRYNCLIGKGNRRRMRCEVALEGYGQEERLQVATYLMAQKRPPIPVRLLLCELAERLVIPQGTYNIQS
jgi:hypothetical protein